MNFDLEGKLIVKGQTQQVSDKFKKREFVIEVEKQVGDNTYTETIKFQLVQDNCDLLEDYALNETIKVSFNIRGNKWEKDGKTSYFVNLDAWRLNKETVSTPSTPNNVPPVENGDNNDLPF